MGFLFILAMLVLIIALAAGISALFGWIFMLVWNFAIVDAFHAPVLDFWHAWAIWFIISLIGGAFRSTVTNKKD